MRISGGLMLPTIHSLQSRRLSNQPPIHNRLRRRNPTGREERPSYSLSKATKKMIKKTMATAAIETDEEDIGIAVSEVMMKRLSAVPSGLLE